MDRAALPKILRGLQADRRGGASLFFAACATVLFGCMALGTEAGGWYLTRRHAQNAADAAAMAAALMLASNGDAAASQAAARAVATRNGFIHGGVTEVVVNAPPLSGPAAGSAAAVEVVIRQRQDLVLAGLVMAVDPVVQTRAVARVLGLAPVCALALTGSVSMGGNSFTSGGDCVLASNSRGSAAIQVYGNADVVAYSLSTSGQCSGCDQPGSVQLTRRYAEYQPPATNPFAALDTLPMPSFSGSGCMTPPNGGGTLVPFNPSSPKAYCGDVTAGGSKTLTFVPGHYYIHNGWFDVQSNSQVVCPTCTGGAGVTIVFTGTPASIGGPRINGNAAVTLSAPSVSSVHAAYNGMLFVRDPRATTTNGIIINGNAQTTLAGGMYFPRSNVQFNGNAELRSSSCTALVADSLDFTGNADVYLDISGCSAYGTPVPQSVTVRLSE